MSWRDIDLLARPKRPGPRGLGLGVLAFFVATAIASLAIGAELSPPAPPAPAASATPTDAAATSQAAPDSPRASIRRYLELCRAGDFAEAARFLDIPPKSDGALLAQQLKAVLDRHLWIDPDALSPQPLGDQQDNLAPGIDQIGFIPGPSGREPVRLVRRMTGDGVRWVFTRATVERIDDWYARLDDRWLRDHLPPSLLRPGPRELLWWQWLALPVLSVVGLVVGKLFSFLTRAVLRRLVRRTASTLDDELLNGTRGPLTFTGTLLAIVAALPWLQLYPPAELFLERVLRAALFLAFFWFLMRAIDTVGAHLLVSPKARDNPAARSLVPLLSRVAKVSVAIMGVIAVLSELGYPVASLIAGLGIGGVAVALAAQKTVENLFGSISIGIDRPFRVGDFVRVDAVLGTVEAIGLRSTRIRTLDRTLVTIPNGKLADMQIESYAARDRIRLALTLRLVYETSTAQLKAVLEGCERALREHPRIWPDEVVTRFVGPGPSGLEIEIMAWFDTLNFDEFRSIRQSMLLSFMQVIEASGSRLALPSQTVYVAASDEPRARSSPA